MKSKKLWLLLSTVAVGSSLAACSGNSESGGDSAEGEEGQASGDQVVDISISDEIPSMDPSLVTDQHGMQWTGETYEGLYRTGEEGDPVEGIAMDHETSEDGLTWTFNLREDAEWENGDPVTANDFVYAWQRAVDPDTASEYGPYMMGGVIDNATEVSQGEMDVEELGVEAVDDYTLEVTLDKVTPYFESLTTFPTFLPLNESFVEEQGENFALEAENTLSNGPFKMTEWSHGESMKFEKNDTYWDADTVQLSEINAQVVKETSTGVNLFETGELDRVSISAEYVDQYSTEQSFRTIEEPSVFFLKMNQSNDGPLANENVRKAIAQSIDKEGLADTILNDGSFPANGLVPENFVTSPESDEGFREANGDLLPTDKEAAQEAWAAALEELGTDTVEIEMLGDDTDKAQNINAYFKNQLEENLEGLTLNVKSVPFKERLRLSDEMDYELSVSGWSPDFVDANSFMNMFVTDGGYNQMGYSNEEYDALIEEAAGESADDPQARWDAFLEAEKILVEEDAAIAPLYQRSTAYLWNPALQGVYYNAAGHDFEYKWAYVDEEAAE